MAYMIPYAGADPQHIRKLQRVKIKSPKLPPKKPRKAKPPPPPEPPLEFPGLDIPFMSSAMRKVLFDVSRKYGVHPNTLVSEIRGVKITMARWEYCYRCRFELNKSLLQIGRSINKDHTTVRYACAMFEKGRVPFGFKKEIIVDCGKAAADGSG